MKSLLASIAFCTISSLMASLGTPTALRRLRPISSWDFADLKSTSFCGSFAAMSRAEISQYFAGLRVRNFSIASIPLSSKSLTNARKKLSDSLSRSRGPGFGLGGFIFLFQDILGFLFSQRRFSLDERFRRECECPAGSPGAQARDIF